MKRRRNLEEGISKACAEKYRQGGYNDPAMPEAWEAWNNYTISQSYPCPGDPAPNPNTLNNSVIDFEFQWLGQNHPELVQYAACHLEKPSLLMEVIGTLLGALAVAWFSIAFFGYVSMTLIILYFLAAALWCWGQHKLYRNKLRQFCQRYQNT